MFLYRSSTKDKFMNSLPKTNLKLTEYLSQLADLELAENHKRFLKAYQPEVKS